MSWLCNCGIVNSSANESCPGKYASWKQGVEHKQVSPNSLDWIQMYLAVRELNMTPQEELFAKLYNHEKVLVKDMDVIQIRDHREELQQIAFEAKARLSAADDELRERKAKTNNKEWLVTETEPNQTVTDAINAVKRRAVRMSKMDKTREQLKKAGLDDNLIKEMIGNLEKKATDKNLKLITFTKPTTEMSAVQVKEQASEPAPFDASKLQFKPKE
jgi:hypothetical protein